MTKYKLDYFRYVIEIGTDLAQKMSMFLVFSYLSWDFDLFASGVWVESLDLFLICVQ